MYKCHNSKPLWLQAVMSITSNRKTGNLDVMTDIFRWIMPVGLFHLWIYVTLSPSDLAFITIQLGKNAAFPQPSSDTTDKLFWRNRFYRELDLKKENPWCRNVTNQHFPRGLKIQTHCISVLLIMYVGAYVIWWLFWTHTPITHFRGAVACASLYLGYSL